MKMAERQEHVHRWLIHEEREQFVRYELRMEHADRDEVIEAVLTRCSEMAQLEHGYRTWIEVTERMARNDAMVVRLTSERWIQMPEPCQAAIDRDEDQWRATLYRIDDRTVIATARQALEDLGLGWAEDLLNEGCVTAQSIERATLWWTKETGRTWQERSEAIANAIRSRGIDPGDLAFKPNPGTRMSGSDKDMGEEIQIGIRGLRRNLDRMENEAVGICSRISGQAAVLAAMEFAQDMSPVMHRHR